MGPHYLHFHTPKHGPVLSPLPAWRAWLSASSIQLWCTTQPEAGFLVTSSNAVLQGPRVRSPVC